MVDTTEINDMLKIQANDGNWNYDSYMLGMYNGIELIVSMIEKREPVFRSKPDDGFIRDNNCELFDPTCAGDVQEG